MKKILLSLLVIFSTYTSYSQTCAEPTNLVASGVLSTSATFGWTQPVNPDTTTAFQWEIIALPCGSPAPTSQSTGWLFASVNPFVLTGLNPNTCYCIYVRAVCSATDSSSWSTSVCVSTLPAPPVCGGNFIDTGGVNNNYSNNENQTTIICPTAPGDVVTVTFTSFNTEANQDALYVYSGTSIAGPQISSSNGAGNVPGGLAGGYWGNTIPGPFTSSSVEGCLTFRFVSDANNTLGGWTANVSCGPQDPCIPIVNPAQLTFCDPAELPLYDLNDAVGQIIGGAPNLVVSFYQTLADAQTNTNPITSNTYIPLINPGQQIIYVRVINPVTQCVAFTTLTLNTQNCNVNCMTPINLSATNVNQTSLQVNWQNNPAGTPTTVLYKISIVPYGQLPDNNNLISVNASQLNYTLTNLQNNFCYSIYINKYCNTNVFSDWSSPLNVCTNNCSTNGTCADALRLVAFLDSNSNGIKDANENNFNFGNFHYQLNNSGNDVVGYTNIGQYYIFDTNPLNLYDIQFTPNNSYYNCLMTYDDVSVASSSGITTLYFPVTINQSYSDASIMICSVNNVVPGFIHTVQIYYSNNSPTIIPSGTINFTKDTNLTISSISQAGSNATATGFTYDFTNLLPFESRYFTVSLQVPTIPTVSLGQLVTNSVTISVPNDAVSTNNSSSITRTIVGSYDPNDISESHGEKIVYSNFTNDDYLYYTIRFENTGTASTQFIRVENTLDAQLDETTFEMLYASHDVNTSLNGTNLKFNFYNTSIPPTSLQPDDSHGYIVYKIKPKPGYAIGDIIPNTANIFFDYNPPITTNTFNTEFVAALGNSNFTSNDFVLYPNPAKETVSVYLSNSSDLIDKITVYDMLGKAVKSISDINSSQITTSVSELSKGIYILEMQTSTHLKISKKLVIQ